MHNPVLISIWQHWPSCLDGWICDLVQGIKINLLDLSELRKSQHPLDIRLRIMTGDSGIYAPKYLSIPANNKIETYQKTFYLLSLIDFFSYKKVLDKGYLRWVLYWMAPIWIGYFCLLVPVFCQIYYPLIFILEVKLLILPLVIWLFLSIFFISRQTKYIHSLGTDGQWIISDHEASFLPLRLHNEYFSTNTLSSAIEHGIKLIGLVYATATGFYILLLKLV